MPERSWRTFSAFCEVCFIDRLTGGRYHAGRDSVPPSVSPGAGVAQLVEQRFRKPQVARSIRVAGSIPQFVRASGLYIGLS